VNHQETAALQVIQQAVTVLAQWVNPELAKKCPHVTEDNIAVKQAAKLLSWGNDCELKPLQLLFDAVKLSHDQDTIHYSQPKSIAASYPRIPYPQIQQSTANEFSQLKQEIEQALNSLESNDWQNLSLLTLIIEKFGSFIGFGESDVALVDIARTTATVAAALAHDSTANELSLVAGDLSGIQNFIYTISSDGALKSLRARSFYLQLVTEEVVQQLLAELELPRTNVIYASGGKLYILASGTEEAKKTVEKVRKQFNTWLLDEFQGKVFLALDCLSFPIKDIAASEFAKHWSDITDNLAEQKSCKLTEHITDYIKPRDSYEPCRVCHRDDVNDLKQLNPSEPDSVLACETCRNMFRLGGHLLRVEAIVRSTKERQQDKLPNALDTLSFKLPATTERAAIQINYHLFRHWKQIVPDSDTVLLVNDWDLEHYQFRHFRNSIPLLLGNYAKQTEELEENSFMRSFRSGEMVEEVQGIKRVGYLRMDVDRLGQIFAKGLQKNQTLPRLAGLSRRMSYFFTVYLNSLAENRLENLPEKIKTLTSEPRQNLLFIYAGGDDLFVSGAWNEIIEFAFDVYQCFRAYTGYHPDVTLSAGICIADYKFPLYQAADKSGDAEDAAKGNGRDSLCLFSQVFKWDEWLGMEDIKLLNSDIEEYFGSEAKPKLLGILPFVERLKRQDIEVNCSRNFVRNLLITAEIQEEELKKFEDKKSKDAMDRRYYLHLPKIAYTLARLPKNILDDADFRTSLKSPYNAPYFRAIATWIELLNR
jgi:CRISPR-associated protein Csm1